MAGGDVTNSGTDYSLYIALFGAVLASLGLVLWNFIADYRRERSREREIASLRDKDLRQQEGVSSAWDLARVKLESYFDRNLLQIQLVFVIAVIVMGLGFVFVLWGAKIALRGTNQLSAGVLAAVAGVISQFIAATFMVLYRSTLQQAGEFMVVLARINNVGMAVQILEAIPEADGELKNTTRAEMAKLLLQSEKALKAERPHPTLDKIVVRTPNGDSER